MIARIDESLALKLQVARLTLELVVFLQKLREAGIVVQMVKLLLSICLTEAAAAIGIGRRRVAAVASIDDIVVPQKVLGCSTPGSLVQVG